ncbi:MAG: Beta-lactamase [Bryobacterales bacterium]|nr:Beta-lactamase [Bryobacterales bacterium]
MFRSAGLRLAAVSALFLLPVTAQTNRAVPREPLPPILTPWEIKPTTNDNAPFPGHKVIGNVYYVGTADYASFLITSEQGHILINPDFEDSVDIIRASVEKLGFKFRDIKILLISHAHGDHCAGLAKAKEMTGAQVMVMDADVPAIEHPPTGRGAYPSVPVSRVLHDKDEVKLGGNTLVAHLTPGHTKGNTSWAFKTTEGGKNYDVVVVGSIGVNNARDLVNNPAYPNMVEDYQKSFRVLKALPCDIYLASHGKMYGLNEKYPKLTAGGPNPFVDPEGYKAHIQLLERAFYYKLDWAMRQ